MQRTSLKPRFLKIGSRGIHSYALTKYEQKMKNIPG
jgi:hypothetical protein